MAKVLKGAEPDQTPDGRYIIVAGRLWRATNPALSETARKKLVSRLMRARRAKQAAMKAVDAAAIKAAMAEVEAAKRGLGERGPVWWKDGAPNENRTLVKNSSYAAWWAKQTGGTPPKPASKKTTRVLEPIAPGR